MQIVIALDDLRNKVHCRRLAEADLLYRFPKSERCVSGAVWIKEGVTQNGPDFGETLQIVGRKTSKVDHIREVVCCLL